MPGQSASAFPLWPKGKGEAAGDTQGDELDKESAESKDENKAEKNFEKNVDKKTEKNAEKRTEKRTEKKTPVLPVPVNFVPSIKIKANGGGGGQDQNSNGSLSLLTSSQDPMILYRKAGISLAQERKLRQLAAEYESAQRVRLKLLDNLFAQMREYQFETEPDEKAVLAKQDEINKLSTLMANERIKLLLAIRDVMTHDEKIRLVEELERNAGMTPRNHGGEAPEIKPNQRPTEPD
ncbi:MAG: hypothetical protein KGS72_22085 [Cyanobacteria bacterium REEB67]|nr:hypothetical protein [Cyanobacteria bacterium REEB67]